MARTPHAICPVKQDLQILLYSFIRNVKYALGLACLSYTSLLFAIPPNHPITNTAVVDYQVTNTSFSDSSAVTVLTDASAGNSPPHDIVLSSLQINENLDGGVIGLVSVADLDPTDSHTISVSDLRFQVVGGQLQLVPGTSLDFETEPSVPLSLTATDLQGASVVVQVVVVVIDINESPSEISLDENDVTANTPGANIGLLATTDPDAGDSHTYSVDDPRFEVVDDQLKLVDGESLPLGATVTLNITSTDSGGLSITRPFEISSQPPGGGSGTNSSITLSQFDPAGGGTPTPLAAPICGAAALADPRSIFGPTLVMPGSYGLVTTEHLKGGDALFVNVVDVDANLDPTQIDQIVVTLTTGSGDTETLTIFETTVNSGNFSGYIQSATAAPISGDCTLQTQIGDSVAVDYVDANDANDTATASVAIDPPSLVFDAASGQPISGAQVTLLHGDGSPAQVLADDGATAMNNVQTSGAATPGSFRFPYVGGGSYVLSVVPPNRFRHPSTVSDVDLQSLPGAPYALSPGSRGQSFTLNPGPTLRVDIPLDIVPIVPTPSDLNLFNVVPGGDETAIVTETGCFDGSTFISGDSLASTVAGSIPLPASVDLQAQDRFARGDAVVVRLIDLDQDLDPFAQDTVEVQISVNAGQDIERLELRETGPSTGIFTGFIQIGTAATPQNNNCSLDGDAHSTVAVSYQDAQDAQDTSSASAVFDPAFQVFSSSTGQPVDGASITLIDALTGLPAVGAVFAADGVTEYPVTVVSGSAVTDSGGSTLQFASGAFSFPVVAPGNYRLEVIAPTSYVFPSAATDTQLAALGGSFTIVPGSRGEDFATLAGTTLAFDVPLDPVSVGVFVTKEASKDTLAVGDFVQYRVSANSDSTADVVSAAQFVDTLPHGFRFVSDSLRIDEELAPGVATVANDGRTIRIALGAIAPNQEIVATYVAEVTAGAQQGVARNQVALEGIGVGETNIAFADVVVRNELFTDTTFIVGRVTVDDCEEKTQRNNGQGISGVRQGIGGVRVLLEDGTFVVTDEEGKYHFQGVEPGTHVVQMDTATLPIGLVPSRCEETTAFAGRPYSQFVDLKAGSLWRADFTAAPDAALRREAGISLQIEAESAHNESGQLTQRYQATITKPAIELHKMRALIMLPNDAEFMSGSAQINGASVPDPRGVEMGALNFKLPDTASEAIFEVSFEVRHQTTGADGEAKAVLMFETADEAGERTGQKTAVVSADAPYQGVALDVPIKSRANLPYTLPTQDKGAAPVFDRQYLITQQNNLGIVFPQDRYNPVLPAIPVAVVHPSDTRPHLLVDGELVSPLTLAGTLTHSELGLSLTTWDGVPISETNSKVELQLEKTGIGIVARDSIDVHFSGAPVRAEFLPDRSYLIADGLHPPALAVRFYDRAGYPLRAGTTGEFSVSFPYQALNQTKHLENLDNEFTNHKYRVLTDGVAYLQLEPTVQTGEVELKFRFDAVRQETIRARLVPGQREWIMVGLLEGSFTERELDGNLEALAEADLDVERDGRAAFYAKGTVKGEWLLTVAYDTAKKYEQSLYEQIDPNQYYTLYGDGTDQLHDAQSQQKLYLKIEKGRFAGLFGDFDTEFQKSQLARYERRLNGVATGYYGRRFEVKGFLSETEQGFVRDEIQGDGTSGVYRLSQGQIVRASELVKVVTRDRFSPTQVLSENTLARYQDYSIDYDRGTLIFRQPIAGQDAELNPVFINVEYEVEANAEQELVGGVRAAYRLDDQDSEIAMTYLRDESEAAGGELLAADVTWQFTEQQKITVEVAESDQHELGVGQAYLLEFEHNGEHVAGRAYLREQDQAFGLGHQSAFERGVRQYGVEGEYRATEKLRVRGQAFEQTLLEQGTDRRVIDTEVEYQGKRSKLRGGLRSIEERTLNGSADATQVTFGVSREVAQKKLNLRVDGEVDLSSNTENVDYPDRVILGAEYKILPDVTLIGEHELTFSDLRDTQDSRIGLRAKPWQGADLHSMLHREGGEQGERLFATTGVTQQWRLSEAWLFDVGFDQVNTFNESAQGSSPNLTYNPFNPTASGSTDNDYNAYFVGAGYQQEAWAITTRLERHQGDVSDKWNFLAGANRQLAEGRVISGSLALLSEELSVGGINEFGDLRFGLAWRPGESALTILNRTDFIYEKRLNGLFDTTTRKWVNNSALNYKPDDRHQLSVHLGLKYTQDQIDDQRYAGMTTLLGSEYRYHFLPRWDVGIHGSILNSLRANTSARAYGLSLGFRAMRNSWLSVGYNFSGFVDDDFVGAEYAADGLFVKFRIKFDQNTARDFLQHANIRGSRTVEHANGG